ncbi:MAG: HEPN domain-containing protein [Desulfobacterales bacterium]|nr:HEPN domain-containing protein [Desulfobacterales bacterium]
MKSNEREARRWFDQAQDDMRFVEWVRREGVFFDKGCFISQQSGEKALKACLYARGERRVLGHSLFELLQELKKGDTSFEGIADAAKRLDRFYIPTRYPNGLPGGTPYQVFSASDLSEALEDLTKVMETASDFLQKHGISV